MFCHESCIGTKQNFRQHTELLMCFDSFLNSKCRTRNGLPHPHCHGIQSKLKAWGLQHESRHYRQQKNKRFCTFVFSARLRKFHVLHRSQPKNRYFPQLYPSAARFRPSITPRNVDPLRWERMFEKIYSLYFFSRCSFSMKSLVVLLLKIYILFLFILFKIPFGGNFIASNVCFRFSVA